MSFKPGDIVECTVHSDDRLTVGRCYEVKGIATGERITVVNDYANLGHFHEDQFRLATNYTSYVTQDTTPQVNQASKNDQGKPDVSLIPMAALEAAARAFEVGEKKYGRYNYYKGHRASKLIAAMKRHAGAWMEGEENDPKDGQPHLGSVIACASMLLQQIKLGTLIDDRYKEPNTKEDSANPKK